jgi:hypothetical protein
VNTELECCPDSGDRQTASVLTVPSALSPCQESCCFAETQAPPSPGSSRPTESRAEGVNVFYRLRHPALL